MTWYIWMEGGRPHLGFGRNMEEGKKNDISKHWVSSPVQFLPTDESWLKSEIEKLEQERRNLKIPPEPLF